MSTQSTGRYRRFRDRLFWLKSTLVLGLAGGFLLSIRLWAGPRSYPLTPVFEMLPNIPALLSSILFAALLILLATVLLAVQPRGYILAFVVIAGLMSLWDQSRWQPWFYQYLLMLTALSLYPWSETTLENRQKALNICRLIVASIYFWSGLQKLNVSFVEDVYPWLIEPLINLLPGSVEGLLQPAAIAVPFVEISIGIGLLTRFRNVAVILALFMHAFILFSLGPFGHEWNSIVWPWNTAMMAFVILLFWRVQNFSIKDIMIPKTSLLHAVILILVFVMPVFSFFGLWDSYLSASLYSGNTKSGILYVSEDIQKELSSTIPSVALKSYGEDNVVDVSGWSIEELNVPPYPETRIYKNVAEHVCSFADRPTEVFLIVQGKPDILNGNRGA